MYWGLCLATGAALQVVCVVEMLVVCRKVSMACTGGDESAKYLPGQLVLAGAAFFCMGSDIQGFVGFRRLISICCICPCTEPLFCLPS